MLRYFRGNSEDMKELKLISVLKTFSKDEIKEFEKFIISPFHNKGRNFKPLFGYLKKLHPDYPPAKLSAEKIFTKLYPGKVYDKSRSSLSIRVLFSQLTQMAEEFLVHNEISGDEYERTKIAAGIFEKRHLYENCEKNILRCTQELVERGIQSNYPDEMTELNSINFLNKINQNKQHSVTEIFKFNPLYLVSVLFREMRPLLNNKVNFGTNDDIPSLIFKDIIYSFDPDKFREICTDDSSGIKQNCLLDYYLCRLRFEENYEIYKLVYEEYVKSFSMLSHYFKWSFFTAIFNLGYIKAHSVDYEKYGKILLELSSITLEGNIFSLDEDRYLYAAAYEMIFNIYFGFVDGIKLAEFKEMHLEKVKKDQRKYINRYSDAFIDFKNGEYESALKNISGLKPEAIIQKNILYRLKICCLIEAGYYDSAWDTIDSYARFLSGNSQVSRIIRKYGSVFLSGIKVILRKAEKDDQINLQQLINAANDNRNSHFGWWFRVKAQ